MNTTTRRQFLQTAAGGIGGLALTSMLARGAQPHHAARAKRVIQIFCPGGMSHVDTFDYKPELIKRAGKPFDPDGKLQFFASKPGNCQPSYYPFKQHGECGRWVSDLFPKLSTHVDDMAFIYSMQSKTALHGPGCFMMNTGQTLPGFPSMGAWVTYGLGSECDNLPSFVVLPDPRGLPPGGPINWGAGFLPAVHQATTLDATNTEQPIADLFPPKDFTTRQQDQQTLGFLQKLNAKHRATRAENTELDARIAAYEMAARLQLSAPEVTNLSGETELTKKLYAIDDPEIGPFGRQCLMARRLAERGVRFIQIYCGAENTTAKKIRPNWDSHEDLVRDHGYWGAVLDTGASALLADLKSRGLLEDTLVICTTEFGRQPAAQGSGKGRDHNAGAFTAWMAGGGIKGGTGYGSTDELGFKALENITHSYELHATALHLLGIDHEKLTFYHNGLQQRLTGLEGHGVIKELLA
jgi:hypothetical protein|uniref:DUF1501 domain-containing protein n=1 Tax=Prosthecobacter sp. TaxID=1965333 RepID=UPI003784BFE3